MLRNERKIEVLNYVHKQDEVTSSMLSNDLSIEIHHARNCLKRYWRQGLLSRTKDGIRMSYALTEKGYERLDYLETVL